MAKTTFEVVRDVIVDKLNISEDQVVLEAEIAGDLGADSLDAIELIMALEEIYETEIEPEQAEGLVTVGDVVAVIDSLAD